MSTATSLVHPEIEKALVKNLEKKQYSNVVMTITPGSVKGDNYLGIIAKAVIEATDPQGKAVTLHHIVKISSQNDEYRAFTHVDKIFGREAYMYDVVLPSVAKFQEEVGVTGDKAFLCFTQAYYTCLEPYREAIVMEDMKNAGYIMRNRKEPLDITHSLKVMKEYGRFHAVSFAMKDQQTENFQKLADNLHESWFHDLRRVPFEKLLAGHNALGKGSLRPDDDPNAKRLHQEYVDNCYDRLMATLRPDAAGQYAVIGHGDSWVNNILFKYESSDTKLTTPTTLCLLDFQLSRIGSPALDIAYFIYTCTDQSLRDAHFTTLLDTYYSSLCSHGKTLGTDVTTLFPRSVLDEHMRKFAVYGLMMTCMVLHVMMSEADEIPDTRVQSTDEMIEAMSFKSKNEGKVQSRLRDVILDMYKRGYLGE